MKRNRLLLEVKKGDSLSFTIQGCDEIIGTIKLDKYRSPRKPIHLTIEFIPAINVVRASAKKKSPKERSSK